MDIEKLKAEFEQSECFKRLEHVAQYTFFEFGAYIKRTDVPDDIEKKCGKLITALIFSWEAWREAKANAVPEGFVLVPKKPDVDKAWDIALKRIVPPPKTNDAIQQELMCKKYVDDLCSEQDRILLDYEAMIEAQELAND